MLSTARLGLQLSFSRIRNGKSGPTMDIFSIIAFVFSSFLALTVAGGTWMFVERNAHPTARIIETLNMEELGFEQGTLIHVVLAIVACALLVIPVLNLGAGASRLGAQSRATRLASLRLIGMSGSQVLKMSMLETLIQAVIGTLLGTLLWLASLPLWQGISFQGQTIAPQEMLLPFWLWGAVLLVIVFLAVISTIIGLRRVQISPLGVARRENPKKLKLWRLVFLVVAIIAFMVINSSFNVLDAVVGTYIVIGGTIVLVIFGINVVGPLILQTVARLTVRSGRVAQLVASRRIIADPKGAWRNVSGIALLGLIATFGAMIPADDPNRAAYDQAMLSDLRTGVYITFAVGLVVAAVSTLISQASIVLERTGESKALSELGFPNKVFAQIRVNHVLWPLILTLAFSIAAGLFITVPFSSEFRFTATGIGTLAVLVASGILLSLLVALACTPLQKVALSGAGRRND